MLTLEEKIAGLHQLLQALDRVVVCFSGGVDSGYLLAAAVKTLEDRAIGLTAISPSLAPEERDAAVDVAQQIGARHVVIATDELDDARYTKNPVNRCYFCKTEVYSRAIAEARKLGSAQVLDGFNSDDRGDHRPGRQAARELGVRSPLDELDFTKMDIRTAARRLGLPIWNKPALACLSSRFPYGVSITPERLKRVARCEAVLRALNFTVCRVRFHGTMARIEVKPTENARLQTPDIWLHVRHQFQLAGFDTVTIDPRGYRPGSLNERLLPAHGETVTVPPVSDQT